MTLMIKRSVIAFLFILLGIQSANAQYRTIRGQVTDEAKHPLASANIGIISNSITTITNRSGRFTLAIPARFQNDSLRISYTGFQTITIAPKDLLPDTSLNIIILTKSFTGLPEVVVTIPDARELIMEAVRRIPQNIFEDSATISSFYRELVRKGEKPMVLSEAAFELFNTAKIQNKRRPVRLLQKRSVLDEKETAGLEFGMSTEAIHHFDIVREINNKGVLNTGDFKNYIFRYKGEGQYAGQPVIMIGFDQNDEIKKSLYKGTILLDKATMAFVSFEFGSSPKGIKYAEYASGKMKLLLRLLSISITLNGDQYKINYRKLNNRWILSDAKTFTSLTFKSHRRQFDFPCFISGDFINTAIDTSMRTPFDAMDLLPLNRSIKFEPDEPGFVYWKDY
ncbi:MAG: carboxypeptidase-like regulatory domain-containing protein, partial [Flavitalea sp.]